MTEMDAHIEAAHVLDEEGSWHPDI